METRTTDWRFVTNREWPAGVEQLASALVHKAVSVDAGTAAADVLDSRELPLQTVSVAAVGETFVAVWVNHSTADVVWAVWSGRFRPAGEVNGDEG